MSPRFIFSVKPETRGGLEPMSVPNPIPSLGTVKKKIGDAKKVTKVERKDILKREDRRPFLILKFPLYKLTVMREKIERKTKKKKNIVKMRSGLIEPEEVIKRKENNRIKR